MQTNATPLQPEAFNKIPIKWVGNATIYMRDVADVRLGGPPKINAVPVDVIQSMLFVVTKSGVGESTTCLLQRTASRAGRFCNVASGAASRLREGCRRASAPMAEAAERQKHTNLVLLSFLIMTKPLASHCLLQGRTDREGGAPGSSAAVPLLPFPACCFGRGCNADSIQTSPRMLQAWNLAIQVTYRSPFVHAAGGIHEQPFVNDACRRARSHRADQSEVSVALRSQPRRVVRANAARRDDADWYRRVRADRIWTALARVQAELNQFIDIVGEGVYASMPKGFRDFIAESEQPCGAQCIVCVCGVAFARRDNVEIAAAMALMSRDTVGTRLFYLENVVLLTICFERGKVERADEKGEAKFDPALADEAADGSNNRLQDRKRPLYCLAGTARNDSRFKRAGMTGSDTENVNIAIARNYNAVVYDPAPNELLNLQNIIRVMAVEGETSYPRDMLDLGCGTGAQLENFANSVPGNLVGADISSEACKIARKRLSAYGSRATIFCADLLTLDEKQLGEFDMISCIGVVYVTPFEVQEKILTLAGRCLRPSGVAIISYYAGTIAIIKEKLYRYLRRIAFGLSPDRAIEKARIELVTIARKSQPNPSLLEVINETVCLDDVTFFHEVLNHFFYAMQTTTIEKTLATYELEFVGYLGRDIKGFEIGNNSQHRAMIADAIDLQRGGYRYAVFARYPHRRLG
ncbi:hypothetical protein AMST5_03907 [freshwater sediment metagenome]|uniref:Methyltransferase domain-containing protein n=1 Tax=freshwater sediment metagenome TaxID=556182 RepID=A0AA48M2R9_9ZZZZ